ncbi:glycoside hydrolase family 28 protein [Marinimicrobium alkaliphilum]|uniref:glycoside hydrolase family 28 protein n=1 Tax=Marinimicrobium alkaliphilum TaxID=2202654 RepID=UPI0018E066A6|nr:glycoside hydrolase family 28 protein [Marinimicrobium alkaliphilum]
MQVTTLKGMASAALLSLGLTLGASANADTPYEIAPIQAPFPMPQMERPSIPDRTFNIRDFGAETFSGSQTSDKLVTEAIHRAIEAANRAGGGKVVIPRGQWLTGPIHLMSNINLHVEEGAQVFFTTDREEYLPVVLQRHEGVEALNYSPLLYGTGLKNVAITGKGVFEGQGESWWEWYRELGAPPRAVAAKSPLSRRDFGKGSGMEGMRPSFLLLWESENILIEGITLNDSPFWNVHLVYSENAIVRDVRVNSLDAPNGDGIVVDSSKNVLLEYNHLETGDDAVVIKSGMNEDGLAINIPTENVVVRNFRAVNVRTGSGGVVFGSETSGGIRNVYVYNGFFDGADRGIRFKTERGRGNVIENIHVRDIEMHNITYEAINVNTFYTGPSAMGPSPTVRDIFIRNVSVDGVPTGISFIGLPEKWLENIHLENIEIKNAEVGAQFNRVKDLYLKNVTISSKSRALTLDQVYEVRTEDLTLRDETGRNPLYIMGPDTGAIFVEDDIEGRIDFGPSLSDEILNPEDSQAW